MDLIKAVWAGLIILVQNIIKLLKLLVKGGIEGIKEIPVEFLFLLGGAALVILFSKNLRKKVGSSLLEFWDEIKPAIESVKELFKDLVNSFSDIWDAMQPMIETTADIITYFVIQSNNALEQLEDLESMRPE